MSDNISNIDNILEDDLENMFKKYMEIKNTIYDLENVTKIGKYDNSLNVNDVNINFIEKENNTSNTTSVKDICNECDSSKYLVENQKEGSLICSNCGLIVRELLDESAEWRNYDGENINSVRTSGVINYYLPNTSMKINIGGNKNSFLKKVNSWSNNNYVETKRMINMCFIKKICEKISILKIIEDDAIILYCKLSDIKYTYGVNKGKNIIMRGLKRTGFIAACLFHAFKKNKNDKVNKEIAKMFGVKVKVVTDGIKKFKFLLNAINYDINTTTSFVSCYIQDFCTKLGIYEKDTIDLALKIAKNMQTIKFLSSHKPVSIAAILVYIVLEKSTNYKVSKKFVSAKLDISEVTLEKLYDIIQKKYDILINDEYIKKHKEAVEKKRKEMKIPDKIFEYTEHLKSLSPGIFDNVGI